MRRVGVVVDVGDGDGVSVLLREVALLSYVYVMVELSAAIGVTASGFRAPRRGVVLLRVASRP